MILTKRVFADMVASSVSAILAALEPRALRLFLRAVKIWRVEERALHPGKQTMQRAGPNLARLRERVGDRVQEGVTSLRRDRLGGGHHGIEFGIG
jgi:hypothetical protein